MKVGLVILLLLIAALACSLGTPQPSDCWNDVTLNPQDLRFGVQYRAIFSVYYASEETPYYTANAFFGDGFYVVVLGHGMNGNEPFEAGYDYDVRFTFRTKTPRGATVFDVHEVVSKTKTTKELPNIPFYKEQEDIGFESTAFRELPGSIANTKSSRS